VAPANLEGYRPLFNSFEDADGLSVSQSFQAGSIDCQDFVTLIIINKPLNIDHYYANLE